MTIGKIENYNIRDTYISDNEYINGRVTFQDNTITNLYITIYHNESFIGDFSYIFSDNKQTYIITNTTSEYKNRVWEIGNSIIQDIIDGKFQV